MKKKSKEGYEENEQEKERQNQLFKVLSSGSTFWPLIA